MESTLEEFKGLKIDEQCVTCKHFKAIRRGHLYRCTKYCFRMADNGPCPNRTEKETK